MFETITQLASPCYQQTGYHAFLITLLIFALSALMVHAQPILKPKPNILVILVDDLGWAHVSAGPANFGYGSQYHQTPQIDALAAQGASFTSAYTQQNCAPTRTALMAGQYATRTKSYNVGDLDRGNGNEPLIPAQNIEDLQPESVTIAEALQDAGYVTAHFGKTHAWQSSQGTTDHGWNESFAAMERSYLATQTNGQWHFEGSFANLDIYAQPYDAAYLDKLRPFENGFDVDKLDGTPKHLTDALADAAIDFMRARTVDHQPFFAFIAFHAVHYRYVPRADIKAKYVALPSVDPRHTNSKFAAFVETVDQAVGRIVAFLDNPDEDPLTYDTISDKTLVVFLSDNGGHEDRNNSPLRGGKGAFWEGGIRIPMIARMPGWIPPLTISNELVHVVDLYPTFLELVRDSDIPPPLPTFPLSISSLPTPPPHILDGESLVPLLEGTQANLVRDAIYWHFPGYLDTRIPQPLSVITKRIGDIHYKLFYYYTGHYELYNLNNDVSESIDLLAGTPTCISLLVASEMAEDLKNWLLETGADFPLVRVTDQLVSPPPPIEIPLSC